MSVLQDCCSSHRHAAATVLASITLKVSGVSRV